MSKIIVKPRSQFYVLVPFTTVPQEISGSDIPSPSSDYSQWAASKGVGGPTENPEGDVLPNLCEWAFGGDPTRTDYRGVVPFVGWTATDFILYFKWVLNGVPGASLSFEVGNGSNWRAALPADVLKTVDGLTWQPVVDDADLQSVINGKFQLLRNVHPATSSEGLIRVVVSYEF